MEPARQYTIMPSSTQGKQHQNIIYSAKVEHSDSS